MHDGIIGTEQAAELQSVLMRPSCSWKDPRNVWLGSGPPPPHLSFLFLEVRVRYRLLPRT